MTKNIRDQYNQRQQRWLREHTLTWTQTQQLIESKLERARQHTLAAHRRFNKSSLKDENFWAILENSKKSLLDK
jgi:hypothetical protein